MENLKKGPVQQELFSKQEHFLITELRNLDISQMRPIDAINFLNDLQEKIKQQNGF